MTPTFLVRGSRYWLLAGAVLFGLYLPLLYRDWLSLRKEAIHDIEWHTSSLARLMSRDLSHHRNLQEILTHLDEPQTRREFEEHVRQKIGYLGLMRLTIYSPDGRPVYRSDGEPLVEEDNSSEFRQALTGQPVTRILDPDAYTLKHGDDIDITIAETYLPIPGAASNEVIFVLEAYYDATPIIVRMHHLFFPRAISLALVLLGVGGASAFILRRNLRLSDRVEQLEAFLPICSHCKKIRIEQDERTEWVAIDRYFSEENHISFSHGICDDCLAEHYPEVARKKKEVRSG